MTAASKNGLSWHDLLFATALSTLLAHELDAVAQAEWRLLPILNQLTDHTAFIAFVMMHVPLVALILWLVGSTQVALRRKSQLVVDAFMVIHVGLHMLFTSHHLYTFHQPPSQLLIFGAGGLGLLHFLLLMRARQSSAD